MKAQKKKLECARLRNRAEHSDDSDEEKDSEEEDAVGVRGKRKQDFYGDEEIDHEDAEEEEDRKDEEAAARAAQKQRAGKMRLGDFGLEDEEDDSEEEASSSSEEEEEEEEEDSEEMTLQQKAQRSKLGAKKTPLEEEEEEEKGKQKKKKRSKTSDGGSGGVVVEALDDDEKRAKREKLENASANADEAEEVRALAEELQKTLAEVETNVEPIVKSAKRGEYLTEEGISYLDTKYMLLLSYCVNLTFYLLMKSEGKSIKDHPVVMRLVEIRSYIEKLRPIDKKLHYQVCFLLICLFPRSCVCMQRAKIYISR
jgi:U3 small nucleolar RNA-associated protein 3